MAPENRRNQPEGGKIFLPYFLSVYQVIPDGQAKIRFRFFKAGLL
jgi:hypothetical protein